MTKEELKVMIDNTINSNGKRSITGKSLNLALSQIVDCIGEDFNNREVEVKRNDVNFFDYDGTLLYAYTWEDAQALTELPQLPVHDGLEVREWNYTLEDIKAQGGIFFIDVDGTYYTYDNIVTIDGVEYKKYAYFDENGEQGEWYIIHKSSDVAEIGTICYWYYDDGEESYIDVDDDGNPWVDYITNAGKTIGKADVGACVYDSNGEQMLGSNVLIIERGETYLPDIYGQMFAVVSIPNTITIGGASSLYRCQFFGELKLPISLIPTNYDNYSYITFCVVDSIHINGLPYISNGYWYQCTFRDIYIPQNTFLEESRLTYDVMSPYIKVLPHISYISEISTNFHYTPSDFCIIDCSDYTYVPELGYAHNGCLEDPDIVIVPDELYDEWINATNWANIGDNIKPASECKNIIRK